MTGNWEMPTTGAFADLWGCTGVCKRLPRDCRTPQSVGSEPWQKGSKPSTLVTELSQECTAQPATGNATGYESPTPTLTRLKIFNIQMRNRKGLLSKSALI
jgi:hypothetical protein